MTKKEITWAEDFKKSHSATLPFISIIAYKYSRVRKKIYQSVRKSLSQVKISLAVLDAAIPRMSSFTTYVTLPLYSTQITTIITIITQQSHLEFG